MLDKIPQNRHKKSANDGATNTIRSPDQSRRRRAIMANCADGAANDDSQQSSTEIWRPVPSEAGVLASSWGRILLPPRYAPLPHGGYRAYFPKPRYGQVSWAKKSASHTYRIIMLRCDVAAAKQKPRKVHQLICEAFHGPAPFDSAVVIHIDEDAHNNRPENLRWGTQKENLNMPKFKAWCSSDARKATLRRKRA